MIKYSTFTHDDLRSQKPPFSKKPARQIRTVWIVKFNENIARFVTAIPDRQGGL